MKQYELMRNSIMDAIPGIWDADNKTIQFGYVERTSEAEEGEEAQVQYHGYAIPLSGCMDYGHIKSEIVKFAYPDKDVDALLNNAVGALIRKHLAITLSERDQQAIYEFSHLDEWRAMAGSAAKELMDSLK